ncbi:Gastrula zinc finger [Pelobates cultripes]|nr:Gastrula zinc finger [Pelobates cultripes]
MYLTDCRDQKLLQHLTNCVKMNKDKNEKSERILNLTLEIIYLLTGEDYMIVKKLGECETHASGNLASEVSCSTQSPSMVPPPHSLIHERNNEKIVTNKNQLTGEVPIRCQDIAVFFSVEEWKYLERHRDLYNDVIKVIF